MPGATLNARSARTRIWTENFGTALFALGIAIVFAFLPALVKWLDLVLAQHHAPYVSFTDTLPEFFLGSLAMTLSAGLNYFESQNECQLGRTCGILSGFSIIGAIVALSGFFIVYYRGAGMFDPKYDTGVFAWASGVFIVLIIPISSLSILQGRRMKDNTKEQSNGRG